MKAIFCDFYGTIVHENGPISIEVIKRVYNNGSAPSPEAIINYWRNSFRKRTDIACGENWRPQDAVALENIKEVLDYFNCKENPVDLRDMMNEHWRNPPIYDDAKYFMENSVLPIYFVTNSDDKYILKAMENHNLKPAGVFTSEQAKYSKPKPELFKYALKQTGLNPTEVVHIGDSLDSDVECPALLGIKTLWINRDNEPVPPGVEGVSDLYEARRVISSYLL